MTQVTIFSKPDCCLCGTARMIVGRLRTRFTFEVREVDIRKDAALQALYAETIPVILVNSEEACRGRIDERRIRRLLEKEAPSSCR
jgi:glutaredoxin